MTVPPGRREEIDVREELDVVSIDPLFVERQRNRYASRGVAYVVLLNGVAAIALLVALAQGTSTGGNIKPIADAMMVFGAGAALGLTSALLRISDALSDWSVRHFRAGEVLYAGWPSLRR